MADLLKNKISLTVMSAVLSVFTLIAYHWPFFRLVTDNVKGDLNGVLITVSLVVLMLALNFFFYTLVLYLGRIVGKCLLALLFVGNAICLYFINTYQVLVTDKMMGNVFNTQYSEASGFFSGQALLYILFLGILPAVYLFMQKTDYGKPKRFFAGAGLSLGLALLIAFGNMTNWPWIDRHATKLGSLLMPWSYTVNSIRFYNAEKKRNRKAIPLPDARIATPGKDVCVLIIGESARRENFSLYGYGKPTNPLLEKDSVTALMAEAAATYTTAGVKAILDHKPTKKLYEILPNYLFRNGVDVTWRTTNWGEPPVHIDKYYKAKDLQKMNPEADGKYDEILLAGLKEEILSCTKDKMLVILHTSTSHGPTYNKKYPAKFEVFTPVCTTVEMAKANPKELMNAYDNTIVYTDYLVHSVIEMLKDVPQRRSCVLFVSDHGESLGEGNLYMHGVPMAVAPKEQIEIPFIVWTSDKNLKIRPDQKVGQYHVFHSVLSFLGIDSPVYDQEKDIFAGNKN
ncbi:phosphoethanolamine--lipid A transferase EptA [Bacteroides eggerthii]|uniref:Phosphoethanolamine--lipid A transferase EptA n=1 Tax=Bacteroides eggerthii TaxID=28111 RepID=A0ABT7U9P6_9BACE|nr:phosphoethanolamine--lipid A transferase EptA [Bacteroides eggerthii]